MNNLKQREHEEIIIRKNLTWKSSKTTKGISMKTDKLKIKKMKKGETQG
jgi:hypothetical protein